MLEYRIQAIRYDGKIMHAYNAMGLRSAMRRARFIARENYANMNAINIFAIEEPSFVRQFERRTPMNAREALPEPGMIGWVRAWDDLGRSPRKW